MPILSHVLLEAAMGDPLHVSATDLDMSVSSDHACEAALPMRRRAVRGPALDAAPAPRTCWTLVAAAVGPLEERVVGEGVLRELLEILAVMAVA